MQLKILGVPGSPRGPVFVTVYPTAAPERCCRMCGCRSPRGAQVLTSYVGAENESLCCHRPVAIPEDIHSEKRTSIHNSMSMFLSDGRCQKKDPEPNETPPSRGSKRGGVGSRNHGRCVRPDSAEHGTGHFSGPTQRARIGQAGSCLGYLTMEAAFFVRKDANVFARRLAGGADKGVVLALALNA